MQPGANYVYLEVDALSPYGFSDLTSSELKKSDLTNHHAVKNRNSAIYEKIINKKGTQTQSLHAVAQSAAQINDLVWQPVFEQGSAILIPNSEVIVGFNDETTLDEAEYYLLLNAVDQGIIGIRYHRKNSFIITIDDPSDGRSFEVSLVLSEMDEVAFAEPNFTFIMNDQRMPEATFSVPPKRDFKPATVLTPEVSMLPVEAAAASPVWVTLQSQDFESGIAGWTSTAYGSSLATWERTTHRKHSGSHSLYCAQTGVSAPGPAQNNMNSWFESEIYNLTGYEEVYVEAWFYAVNEVDASSVYDSAALVVIDNSIDAADGEWLAIFHQNDCTTDTTTQNGWRKVVYRVPPEFLVSQASFSLIWESDINIQVEGCYIDDVRIVATTNVDTDPLGNDTYGARLWSHRNTGQIAGLGDDSNDLHIVEAWDETSVSSEIVIAIIDEGVDLTHPDLNLVTGYDHDGSVGGGPRGSHGTACAGEAGAIRNNGIGVIGTAPGVKIMPIYMGDTDAEIANSIDVAVTKGAKILSNSWGGVGWSSTDIEDAINDAIAAGCVVLFAAGNGPDRSPYNYNVAFPGSLNSSSDVICIGASSPTDEHKSASSSDGLHGWGSSYVGAGPDVVASTTWSYTTDWQGANGYNPGGGIKVGDDGNYTHDFGGTSSATPKAAGIVALMLSQNPTLTPAEVKVILKNTANDIDLAGADDKTGAGRVNAYLAVLSSAFNPVESATIYTAGSMVYIDFQGTAFQSFKLKACSSLVYPSWIDKGTLNFNSSGEVTFSESVPESPVLFYKTTQP
ncbi:MAG: S8 family serine peptidase [Pontiella sp.]